MLSSKLDPGWGRSFNIRRESSKCGNTYLVWFRAGSTSGVTEGGSRGIRFGELSLTYFPADSQFDGVNLQIRNERKTWGREVLEISWGFQIGHLSKKVWITGGIQKKKIFNLNLYNCHNKKK